MQTHANSRGQAPRLVADNGHGAAALRAGEPARAGRQRAGAEADVYQHDAEHVREAGKAVHRGGTEGDDGIDAVRGGRCDCGRGGAAAGCFGEF